MVPEERQLQSDQPTGATDSSARLAPHARRKAFQLDDMVNSRFKSRQQATQSSG